VENVALYDESWFEWGNPRTFFPVETVERKWSGSSLPTPLRKAEAAPPRRKGGAAGAVKGGYVSCGG